MMIFALLVLVALSIEAGLLIRRRPHAPHWIRRYRDHTLRPLETVGSYAGLDRDAARVGAEVLAMSRRAPHN